MEDRIEVFVDTSYLLASFYNSWTTGVRAQLEIDLPAVTQHLNEVIEQRVSIPVRRQFWYDGIPDSGPHRYQRTLRHIDGVQLRSGQLIEWGERRTQKGVDTRLVADMVLRSVRGLVSDIALVSGDADMIPGVQIAIDHGVRVHLIGFGWDSISNSLRSACDTITVLDPRNDFENCMHIEVLQYLSTPDGESEDAAEATEGSRLEPSALEGDSAELSTPGIPTSPLGFPVGDEALLTEGDTGHSDPLLPPVLSPGKLGRRGEVRHRVRTNHAVAEGDANSADANGTDANSTDANDTTGANDTGNAGTSDGSDGADSAAVVDAVVDAVEKKTTSSRSSKANAKSATKADEATASEGESSAPTDVTADVTADGGPFADNPATPEDSSVPGARPSPVMMAQKRRPKQRSHYVPLPYDEVWESAGSQTPFDIGQQYAVWWFNNAATAEQRTSAHLLTGGGLPPEIDRPLLQFACQTLDAYTLNDTQRVNLRDGFHMGIRGLLMP